MKSAQRLYRDNVPDQQQRSRCVYRIGVHARLRIRVRSGLGVSVGTGVGIPVRTGLAVCFRTRLRAPIRTRLRIGIRAGLQRFQPCSGPACRACDRLRMKPPIRRVAILGFAGRAHAEFLHRGRGTVVRDRLDDGQSRPAMRAIGEWIAVAPRLRVGDLCETGRAGCRIGHDAGVDCIRTALDDAEFGAVRWHSDRRPFDRVDAGEERWRTSKGLDQAGDVVPGTTQQGRDPGAVVADPAAQTKVARQPPDRGAQADALHLATHPNLLRAIRRVSGPRYADRRQVRRGLRLRFTTC